MYIASLSIQNTPFGTLPNILKIQNYYDYIRALSGPVQIKLHFHLLSVKIMVTCTVQTGVCASMDMLAYR